MHEPQRLHSTFLTMLPRFHSTPLLLQGGDVGQQAFMVELLQLQELNGPLVWWGWQLRSRTSSPHLTLPHLLTPSPRGHKHTRPPYMGVDRLLLSGQPQKHNWRKPYRPQALSQSMDNTQRLHTTILGGTGTFRRVQANVSVVRTKSTH